MNEDHVERLRNVGKNTAQLMAKKGGGGIVAEAIDVAGKSAPFWDVSFPADQGYGESVTLDLSGADLSGCMFALLFQMKPVLRGANFTGACLDRSVWFRINAEGADFSGAKLRNGSIFLAMFGNTTFRGADLTGTDLLMCCSEDCSNPTVDLSEANLTNATIQVTSDFKQIIVTGATMTGCRVVPATKSGGGHTPENLAAYKRFLSELSEEQRAQIIDEGPKENQAGAAPSKGGCFIATAACGTQLAPEVQALRAFRDTVLVNSCAGRAFVRAYGVLSPPIAGIISRSSLLRRGVRRIVIGPLARLAKRRLDSSGRQ